VLLAPQTCAVSPGRGGSRAGGGLFAALRLLSKPESQQSLPFLLSFSENLRKAQMVQGG